MGCMQSEPHIQSEVSAENIALQQKSCHHKQMGNRKDKSSKSSVPKESSMQGASKDSDGTENPHISTAKSTEVIASDVNKLKECSELRILSDTMKAADVDARDREVIHNDSVFPVWKKQTTCMCCLSQSAISKQNKICAEKEISLEHYNPFDPGLCHQCSNVLLVKMQNNLRANHHRNAILLAMTAIDLTAPASDALLKNRKNAWIQLAGHPGSFAPAGPNTIWKKRMEKENYETMTYQALMDEALRDMVPKFYREVEYNGEYFIEMEDLLQHFCDPNIMDIKMGKRTFLEFEVKNPVLRKDLYEKMITIDPNAPTEEERNQEAITKLRYMQFREQESSTSDLGFRIEAIRMSGKPPNTNLKKTRSREQVSEVILTFFKHQLPTLQLLLERLIDIREKFENSVFFQNHEIIGSSLLIMYDIEFCGAWMIDFAKTIPVENGETLDHRKPWKIGTHEDGYLTGLDNIILILQGILTQNLAQDEPQDKSLLQ